MKVERSDEEAALPQRQIAGDICVLFTAADAHMRDYDLWVPDDAVAAASNERGRWALEIMSNSMGAHTSPTTALSVAEWISMTPI